MQGRKTISMGLDGGGGKNGQNLNVDINAVELTNVSEGALEQKLGTKYDQRDMIRMGKRQELRVRDL